MIVVVDLDGTLCNSGHREHLARAGQWDEFHSLLGEDEPHRDVLQLINLMEDAGKIVIGLTGRNEKYRGPTLEWLVKHNVNFDVLLMRPDNDWRSDHELKPAMLDAWLEQSSGFVTSRALTHSDVWFILEDRDKVVEAWRNLGHNCWQCRPGGY